MNNSSILVPVLVAVLTTVGSLAVAVIGGWFLLRGKRIDGPQAALNSLLASAPQLLSTNLTSLATITQLTQTINVHLNTIEEHKNTIEELKDALAKKQADLDRTTAERDLALQAQALAEGRLEGYLAGPNP